MIHYDTNAEWDDPFEHKDDRRKVSRFEFPMRIKIAVQDPEHKCRLIGHGNVINLSRSGLLVKTKHYVEPNSVVSIAISSKYCENSVFLPKLFLGTARVVRAEPRDHGISIVALAFGPEFEENIDFDVFIDSLLHQTMSEL